MVLGNPGQEVFARTGIFHLDANRQVVTSDGYPLLPGEQPADHGPAGLAAHHHFG